MIDLPIVQCINGSAVKSRHVIDSFGFESKGLGLVTRGLGLMSLSLVLALVSKGLGRRVD